MKKSLFGFTLAEVLITLAIIGVVAALTIPTVVRNYQKTQTVTQLKKAYSALSNTTNLAIADEGPITGWEVGEHGSGQAAVDFANKYLVPYLKVSKNCELQTTGLCQFEMCNLNTVGTCYKASSAYARFFLNDGVLVALNIYNTTDPAEAWAPKHADILVDINGQKKPNRFGKDIFHFHYIIQSPNASQLGKLIPDGCCGTRENLLTSTYGCYKDGRGNRCTALIVYDGWKISDDYPW